jgi:hypothetical protein
LPRLVGSGYRTDDIQIGPPQEHLVGTQPGRRNAQLIQPLEDQFVDPASGLRIDIAFERTQRPLCPDHIGHRRC